MTPSTALRLARFLGMRAEYWLDLQARWDLCHTAQAEENALKESDAGHVARTLRLLDALLLLDTEGRLAGVRATAGGEGMEDDGRRTTGKVWVCRCEEGPGDEATPDGQTVRGACL